MKLRKYIFIFFAAWLVLGGYACKTSGQHCDCPTFGNHATGKSGVYKTNSKNRH